MTIWLPATLAAALFQAWRTAVQQRVRGTLSVNGAGLVRYLYGWPVALALLLGWLAWRGAPLPPLTAPMMFWAALGGLCQILATNLLLMAFGYRNYVAGTAYAKTEAIQGAIFALLILGEKLPPLVWAGIGIGVIGVVLISVGGEKLGAAGLLRQLGQPAALCGLGAGALFALTSVFVKQASLEVASGDTILRALVVLVTANLAQTLMQGLYVLWREPGEMTRVFASWRVSAQVGVLAALGSACWFSAFASAPVALVRSVGQVEVIFTLLFGRFYLKEALKRSEAAGLLLIGAGVLASILGAR